MCYDGNLKSDETFDWDAFVDFLKVNKKDYISYFTLQANNFIEHN